MPRRRLGNRRTGRRRKRPNRRRPKRRPQRRPARRKPQRRRPPRRPPRRRPHASQVPVLRPPVPVHIPQATSTRPHLVHPSRPPVRAPAVISTPVATTTLTPIRLTPQNNVPQTSIPPPPIRLSQDHKTPKRKALLIACEYRDYEKRKIDDRLPGCHTDIGNIALILQHQYNYAPEDITILADDLALSNTPPTTAAIKSALQTLLKQVEEEKVEYVLTYYSGHGLQISDKDGDEVDKHDEAIVPVDYRSGGFISDDYLRKEFWTKMPSHVSQVTCVFDCCNSGTMMDLPYKYVRPNKVVSTTNLPSPENGPLVVSISGCKDPQTSASAYNLERRRKWQGAMTWCLTQELKGTNFCVPPLNQLVDRIRSRLRVNGFKQIPQLAVSKHLDPATLTHLF